MGRFSLRSFYLKHIDAHAECSPCHHFLIDGIYDFHFRFHISFRYNILPSAKFSADEKMAAGTLERFQRKVVVKYIWL